MRRNGTLFDELAGLAVAGLVHYGLRALFGPPAAIPRGYEISPGVHIIEPETKRRPSAAERARNELRAAREQAIDAEFSEAGVPPRSPGPG